MATLHGAQRLVLEAIRTAQAGSSVFVEDRAVSAATKIPLSSVRDWFETLESDKYADVVRTTGGLSASITAYGRLALDQYKPFLDNVSVVQLEQPIGESSASARLYYRDVFRVSADFSSIF